MIRKEVFKSIVIKADCVKHTSRGFTSTGWRIACARVLCDGFRNDAAQLRKINHGFHFFRIPKGTGSDKNGVIKLKSAKVNRQVSHDPNSLRGRCNLRARIGKSRGTREILRWR